MARSASFGLNPKKSYGTSQSIQEVVPGRRFSDVNGDWLCITANGAIAQYAWCVFDPNSTTFQAAEMTTTNAGSATLQAGVAQFALATTEVGFIWLGGSGGGGYGKGIKGKVAASYVAKAILYTTATAGVADDASTTKIQGVVGLSTDSGSGSSIELYSSGPIYVN